ncbi:MAG: Arm DNA-binding domain-containing protein [Methylococcaceae bacterium]|nr:Arm DNA-binding domain-containing protein [Methylococcaceae bacterium]MDP3905495.1 Arm DNA-binding domain-containing protein [Methylococcaceae bacterium]
MAINLLTDPALKNAKPESKDKRLLDEGGLYLLIKSNDSKWWRWD